MRNSPNKSPQEAGNFTEGQWKACRDILWDQAAEAADIHDGLQLRANGMYERIQGKDFSRLNLHEQGLRANEESEYWAMSRRLSEFSAREENLLAILERIDSGEATVEEVIPFLPPASDEEQERLSKRRQAMRREKEKLGVSTSVIESELFIAGLGLVSVTDPRRIASGRNRQRLVSANGVSTNEASGVFFDVTADTHGGKSRGHGKSGKAYVGKSGRRIRKY